MEEIDRLREENKRLREALECCHGHLLLREPMYYKSGFSIYDQAKEALQEALKDG